MSKFVDTAVTITYRGYEIRIVGDVVGDRCIIKKDGKIVSEQWCEEAAKRLIDEYVEAGYRYSD